MDLSDLIGDLESLADPKKAEFYPRFFKAGPGGYAEGEKFLGVTIPLCRIIAKKYKDLKLSKIKKLLKSGFHEPKLVALMILVNRYQNSNEKNKTKIYNFYIQNTRYLNNWDLVDSTADKIVGEYLHNKPKDMLTKLAYSKSLWDRRIAIISTLYYIRKGKFEDTIKISGILREDEHDLIHKAVGWMLREIGKRSQTTEETFLKKYYKKMPRTMLRYSIEKFPETLRKAYLTGTI